MKDLDKGKIILFILCVGFLIPFFYFKKGGDSSKISQSAETIQAKNDISKSEAVTPRAAVSSLSFENDQIKFVVDEKGYLYNTPPNLWFDNYFHHYQTLFYLSINDAQPNSFLNFTVVETLHNLTTYDPTNHYIPLVAETIIQHPTLDIFIKIHYKIYPNKPFFVTNFMIYSPSLPNFRAELFYYMDLDIDGRDAEGIAHSDEVTDDKTRFNTDTQSVYIYDSVTSHYLGWVSPISADAWQIGVPSDVWSATKSDSLSKNVLVNNKDCSAATKYLNTSVNLNQIWTIPIIFGFGTSLNSFLENSNAIKNEFIQDYTVLGIIPDLSGEPTITTTILNGGRYTASRNVSVYRNNIYLTSQNVSLKSGEYQSIIFSDLSLVLGSTSEIRVQVQNLAQDFDLNDNITCYITNQHLFTINVQDYNTNNLEEVNVSIYIQGTSTLISTRLTNSYGNVSFLSLSENNYTVVLTALWFNNKFIGHQNISYPQCGDYLTIQTNITTLHLHITDIEGAAIESIAVSIYRNDTETYLFAADTNVAGNITFRWLRGNYNILFNYTQYNRVLVFSPISDFVLDLISFYTHSLPMTRFNLHFNARSSLEEPLVNAKIELYNRMSDFAYGDYIGYEIADSNGNISVLWANNMNYSFRVVFFSEYKLIGDPESSAYNFTFSPFLTYIFAEINVTLQANLDEYTTELVSMTGLPLIYTWEKNISIQFLFNVTGPSNKAGPQWANYTEVIIKDADLQIVYIGTAEIVISERGVHSFVLNTTSGVFTSGNPAIYWIQIKALLIGYSPPTFPLEFSFKVYNISTDLSLKENSAVLYWNDNVTIHANYFDTFNDQPIVDGQLTVTWEGYLINEPMHSLGNGSYTLKINSSLGAAPWSYIIYINAKKSNHDAREQKFLMIINEVPTLVNGSLIFDSIHSIYVTTQNLTFRYYLEDQARAIPIVGIAPDYQIIQEETGDEYIGFLDDDGSGFYHLDPAMSLFPIGTYHGIIRFSNPYYTECYATFRVSIFPIPTSLNDSAIQEVPYEIYCSSDFRLKFTYQNSLDSSLITNASASYQIRNDALNLNATYEMEELSSGFYVFNPYSFNLPIGTYFFKLTFQKMNYSSDEVSFTLFIREIPINLVLSGNTLQNGNVPITSSFSISRGEKLVLQLELKDNFNISMTDCEILCNLSKEGITMQGELLNVGDGVYQVIFPEMKSVGGYTLNLVILAQNHSTIEKTYFIEVNWQRVFGLPLPYWFIIIGLVIAVGIGYSTYRVVHNALIPPMVKKLNWLEKEIKRGQSFSLEILISKEEVFQTKFAYRWAQLDLEHPFVAISPHIQAFIDLYEEHTGKSLLVGDAIQYMEDLSIYSQNEILARLKADGFPDNRIFIALQIIETYIQESNSKESSKNEDKMKEVEK